MTDVVPIYEAKTNLSKLVKRAQAGETIYIGAYGKAEAVLAPLPKKKPITFGVLAHLAVPGFDYDSEELWGPQADEEIWADFFAELDGNADAD